MNLEDLGNIGEIVGALGVIISLVFVGFQIRRNNQNLLASNSQISTSRIIDFSKILIDEEYSKLYLDGLFKYEELDQLRKFRFDSLFIIQVSDWCDMYMKRGQGDIEAELWEANQNNLRKVFSFPGARSWLESSGISLPPSFLRWLQNEVISEDT